MIDVSIIHPSVCIFLYRFPHHDTKLLKKWASSTRRIGPRHRPWKPTKTAVLCSDHFSEDDFISHPGKRKLREGSVPSWFSFSKTTASSHMESSKRQTDKAYPPVKPKRARLLSEHPDVPSQSQTFEPQTVVAAPELQHVTATQSHPVPATQSRPVPATQSRPVPATQSCPVPATQPRPVPGTPQPRPVPAIPQSYLVSTTPQIQSVPATPPLRDHNYHFKAAERHISSPLKKMSEKMRKLRYEKKKLRQKLKRRDQRLKCLTSTLEALKESRIVDADLLEAIRSRFENSVVGELFQNEVINRGRKRGGQRYSEEIKKLCLTLHYYSPRAYRYLA